MRISESCKSNSEVSLRRCWKPKTDTDTGPARRVLVPERLLPGCVSDVEQRGEEEEGLVGGWGFDEGGGETRHLLLLLHLHLHNTTQHNTFTQQHKDSRQLVPQLSGE